MNNQYSLKQVIDILKKEGKSTAQINQMCIELTKSSYAKFYTEALVLFTKEDAEIIAACQNQDEANLKIMEIYKKRTGKDPAVEAQKFLGVFAKGFVEEYQKTHPSK